MTPLPGASFDGVFSPLSAFFASLWIFPASRGVHPTEKWSAIAPGADIGFRYVCFQGLSGRRSTALRTSAFSQEETLAVILRRIAYSPSRHSENDAVTTAPNKTTAQEQYIQTRNTGTADRAP